MTLACKKCKKVFRKDLGEMEEADEFCPHCDNHYVIEAKTPETQGELRIEFKAEKGHEHQVFKDDRQKERQLVLQQNLGGNWSDSESDEDFCMPGKGKKAMSMKIGGKK